MQTVTYYVQIKSNLGRTMFAVIIVLEIKVKSWALLSSNLPSVIDRSNLSPSREAAR